MRLKIKRVLPVVFTLLYTLVVWLMHKQLNATWLLTLKLYPVFMNLGLLIFFGSSLFTGMPVIERIARLTTPNLPPNAIHYTRRVTQVWCVFFVVNGALAAFTALKASPTVWALYNGVIAYILMALLFAIEFCVRLRYQRRYRV